MRFLFISLTVFVAACAATTPDLQSSQILQGSKNKKSQNQPHLPPPDFEATENKNQTPIISETRVPYLHYNLEESCGTNGALGSKRFPPDACTLDYNPVCGCDGKTYSNTCTANSNGVSVKALGECQG